jgi:hypothetical protein
LLAGVSVLTLGFGLLGGRAATNEPPAGPVVDTAI